MFKIVQTTEKGLNTLSIVPAAWEENGKLAWPKSGADKLVLNANSSPGVGWFTMRCKLKRNYLMNYEVAEEELSRMLDESDTDLVETEDESKSRGRKKRPRTVLTQMDNFNNMAAECLESVKNVPVEGYKEVQFGENINPKVSNVPNDNGTFAFIPNPEPAIILNTQTLDPSKIDILLENQATLINNQTLILSKLDDMASYNNQLKIIEQLAKMEAIMDNITSRNISTAKCSSCSTTSTNGSSIPAEFNVIECQEELNNLEKKLADPNQMQMYVKNFGYVCGRKGTEKGINNCYLLVDRIFSRKFLTMCSWAGGSRNNEQKIPFKIYKNTIYMFFKTIQYSDEEFSLKDCELFFKNIIRNSTKRSEREIRRTSSIKKRPKNLKYNIKQKTATMPNNDNEFNNEHQTNQTDGEGEETTGAEYLYEEADENAEVIMSTDSYTQ